MPTPSSLFASAIPSSSLKLAGIKHPPLHPFSSHSFSIPLPHLHGASRVHAILHSFTYPLKPLTQAPISMQPIPNLHATHNNVLPYPDVSHPEFFSANISIRTSCIRKLSPLTFYPDISHPKFLRRHSTRTSRIRNLSPLTFYPDISHPEFLPIEWGTH